MGLARLPAEVMCRVQRGKDGRFCLVNLVNDANIGVVERSGSPRNPIWERRPAAVTAGQLTGWSANRLAPIAFTVREVEPRAADEAPKRGTSEALLLARFPADVRVQQGVNFRSRQVLSE